MPLWDGRETPEEYEERRARNEEFARQREENLRAKEALVREAHSVASTDNWKEGSEEMRRLMIEWKAIGPVDRDEKERIWEEFQSARQPFFDRRTKFFEERDREREANKSAKQDLIRQAQRIAGTTDWKSGGDEMHDLMVAWKEIGSAGKEENDRLREQFQDARQKFFSNRKRAYDEISRQRQANKSKKERIIGQVRTLTRMPLNWREVHSQLQDLHLEWKDIGPAPKEDHEQLREEYSSLREKFYSSWKDQGRRERQNNGDASKDGFFDSPSYQHGLKRDLRQFSGHSSKYNRFIDKLGEPFFGSTKREHKRGEKKHTYAWATEIGRDISGKVITRVDVGTDAYVLTTQEERAKLKGKTTGHASGLFHKHLKHSTNPNKGNFVSSSEPPAGPNLSNIIKPGKEP